MANFDTMSLRPLSMITRTQAATTWYSEDGIRMAKEPKEFVVIEGRHAALYDRVDEAGARCADFFGKGLAQVLSCGSFCLGGLGRALRA